jgi:hypothetical protein
VAGDWIKMRNNLWDDPRVSNLCDLLECGEAQIVGALYWLWATADQHTEDGLLPGLSMRQIDRKTGVPGFANALCGVGWLEESADGVRINRFEEHNGTSAKKRAVTAKRVANHRSNSDVTQTALQNDDASVTGALAREEKRREEKKDSVPNGTGGKPPKLTDPKEIIFGYGLSLLVNAGTPEKQARSFLGGLEKHHGAGALVDKLRECAKAKPLQPLEWLAAALPPHASGAKANAQEALEASNRAVAARFVENTQ